MPHAHHEARRRAVAQAIGLIIDHIGGFSQTTIIVKEFCIFWRKECDAHSSFAFTQTELDPMDGDDVVVLHVAGDRLLLPWPFSLPWSNNLDFSWSVRPFCQLGSAFGLQSTSRTSPSGLKSHLSENQLLDLTNTPQISQSPIDFATRYLEPSRTTGSPASVTAITRSMSHVPPTVGTRTPSFTLKTRSGFDTPLPHVDSG